MCAQAYGQRATHPLTAESGCKQWRQSTDILLTAAHLTQKHAEPIRAWAHPAEAGSVCTYSAAAEGAAPSSAITTTTFPTSQVCFPTSMRQTWLQPLSEHQSGLILRTLQHSRPTASGSMMPYSLPSCGWCRTNYSLSYRKWRCIITKITASSSEWDCTHRCTASSHFR